MIKTSITSTDSKQISKYLEENIKEPAVFMCVGTSKVLSDSIGPLVGDKLISSCTSKYVYGTTESNITALNIKESYDKITALHPNSQIIVVDSAVGDCSQVGKVQVFNSGLFPGLATDKHIGIMGDSSVIGVVSNRNMSGFYCNSADKKTMIDNMVSIIIDSLKQANYC